ncbi:flagellin [Proteiniclasticum ruminis]|uniref:Flagellin n=1 Tax=Proteiniclasticum ruminis TaxID=398199 RepID=A0A1I4ZY24_9CLOT|nr:flagellin [Proteiniclasticum ruminis]SFN55095.1 Flagellin FlgL [Proteiniclasticum ruminis]
MRISQSLFYGDHLRTIGQNRKKSMEKLSSGLAINRAGDNAAGFSISTKLNAKVRGISQARRNIMDAKGLLDVAEMGLQGVNEALHRMRELSVQAASGTLSDLDRKVIQLEMDEVKKVISSAVRMTEYNTHKPLASNQAQGINRITRTEMKSMGLVNESKYLEVKEMTIDNREDVSIGAKETVFAQTSKDINSKGFSDGTLVKLATNQIQIDERKVYTENLERPSFLQKNSRLVTIEGVSKSAHNFEDSSIRMEYSGSTLSAFIKNKGSTVETKVIIGYDFDWSKGFGGLSLSESGKELIYYTTSGEIKQKTINFNTDDQKITIGTGSGYAKIEYAYRLEKNLFPQFEGDNLFTDIGVYSRKNSSLSVIDKYSEDTGHTFNDYYKYENDILYVLDNYNSTHEYSYRDYRDDSGNLDTSVYKVRIPSDMKLYNYRGESGAISLNVTIRKNGESTYRVETLDSSSFLAERPGPEESVNGVYVDLDSGYLEFYGNLRPQNTERLNVFYSSYSEDPQITVDPFIEEDNLEASADTDKALRVYYRENGEMKEISHQMDDADTDSFHYSSETGVIRINDGIRADFRSINSVGIPIYQAYYFENYGDYASSEYKLYHYENNTKYELNPDIYDVNHDGKPDSIEIYRKEGLEETLLQYGVDYTYNSTNASIIFTDAAQKLNASNKYNESSRFIVKYMKDYQVDSPNYHIKIPYLDYVDFYEKEGSLSLGVFDQNNREIDFIKDSSDLVGKSGWYFNTDTQEVILVGDDRPEVGDHITVRYLNTINKSMGMENDSFDHSFSGVSLDLLYNEANSAIKNLRLYRTNSEGKLEEVEHDGENGYLYNGTQISLHGESRPMLFEGLPLKITYIGGKSEFLVKEDHKLNKLYVDGVEVHEANESNGFNGYQIVDNKVVLVGDARLDAALDKPGYVLSASWFPVENIVYDDRGMGFDPYKDQWISSENFESFINKEDMKITIRKNGLNAVEESFLDENGNLLELYFELENGKVVLSDQLKFRFNEYDITLDYAAEFITEFMPQSYKFQVGANGGDSFQVSISAMENMLFTTDQLRLDTREYAEETIGIVDHLLYKVQSEMGSLGATQNRLEAISNNLAVLEENTTSAMSRIMDVDYAKEMMVQIKSSILEQAVIALQVHQLNNSESILSLIS